MWTQSHFFIGVFLRSSSPESSREMHKSRDWSPFGSSRPDAILSSLPRNRLVHSLRLLSLVSAEIPRASRESGTAGGPLGLPGGDDHKMPQENLHKPLCVSEVLMQCSAAEGGLCSAYCWPLSAVSCESNSSQLIQQEHPIKGNSAVLAKSFLA